MKKIFSDIKRYFKYVIYATKAELNAEVAGSYLGALWWLLDPLFFMMIYTFISVVVFKSKEQYFAVFVFTALSLWNFFNKVVSLSPKLVSSNKDIVTKVYLPKYILLINKMGVNFFKMLISFALVAVMMILYKIPLNVSMLHIVPIIITLIVVTFGCSTILMHFGVFVEDLSNITNILLKLVFYLSGIFYLVSKRIPSPYNNILLTVNPMAYLIESGRGCLIYGQIPNYYIMTLWFVIGIILSIIGVKTIYKYENSYVKVIK